jgi:uncharacterized Zn-binding protein involved in type VI secretion
MGQPAAKKGDIIEGNDMHLTNPPPPSTAPPQSLTYKFSGKIDGKLSPDVIVMGQPAATVDSTATNNPTHETQLQEQIPGATFTNPISNKGTIKSGSSTVRINGKAAARNGDISETCNDPVDLPIGKVVASGTVMIG